MNKLNINKNVIVLQLILIAVGVLVLLVAKTNIISILPECSIRSTIGIICPSCGGTRCAINLIQFNFKEAFRYHPVFFITFIYLGIVDLLYIINSIFNKNYLKFLYPSIPILCIFLALYMFQYIFRLYLIFNGININI